MTIKSLRAATGMSQRAFAEYLDIPRRSIENWESGSRACPQYLIDLIEYKLIHENLITQKEQE